MKDLKDICRIALVQAEPIMFDKDACLEKALKNIREAAAEKLDLIVFRFTPTLLQLIRAEAFDRIVPAYFSFTDY